MSPPESERNISHSRGGLTARFGSPSEPYEEASKQRYGESSDRGRDLSLNPGKLSSRIFTFVCDGNFLHVSSRLFAMDSDISPPRCVRHDSGNQDDTQQINKHLSIPELGRISSRLKAMDSDISPPRCDFRYQDDLCASLAANLLPPKKSKNERSSSIVSTRNSIHKLDGNNTANAAPPISSFLLQGG